MIFNRVTLRSSGLARLAGLTCLGVLAFSGRVSGQTPAAAAHGYPVRPSPLPEATEIAMAESAAPREISSQAAVYVLRATGLVKVRAGTNGCTCMVNRDLHEGSLYPICYDREASKTLLQQELMELGLRVSGHSEDDVIRRVAAAYKSGALKVPTKPGLAYMMSPQQVIFSSPLASGVRVGAYHPHVMILMPHATNDQFGMAANSNVDVISLDHSGEPSAQLIVKVPHWADSTASGGHR